MTETRWPSTWIIPIFFGKIESFSKPVLYFFILRNSIVKWGKGVIKVGDVFCIKSIDLGEALMVWESRIHQNKSWNYLGPFQISKVKLFAKIVFGYKPLTHFSPMSHFYTSWKRQKTIGFLRFSGGLEMWHWTKMS